MRNHNDDLMGLIKRACDPTGPTAKLGILLWRIQEMTRRIAKADPNMSDAQFAAMAMRELRMIMEAHSEFVKAGGSTAL